MEPVIGVGIAAGIGILGGFAAGGLMKLWIRYLGVGEQAGHMTKEERAAKVVSKYMAKR
jgi:hypothetical protein